MWNLGLPAGGRESSNAAQRVTPPLVAQRGYSALCQLAKPNFGAGVFDVETRDEEVAGAVTAGLQAFLSGSRYAQRMSAGFASTVERTVTSTERKTVTEASLVRSRTVNEEPGWVSSSIPLPSLCFHSLAHGSVHCCETAQRRGSRRIAVCCRRFGRARA